MKMKPRNRCLFSIPLLGLLGSLFSSTGCYYIFKEEKQQKNWNKSKKIPKEDQDPPFSYTRGLGALSEESVPLWVGACGEVLQEGDQRAPAGGVLFWELGGASEGLLSLQQALKRSGGVLVRVRRLGSGLGDPACESAEAQDTFRKEAVQKIEAFRLSSSGKWVGVAAADQLASVQAVEAWKGMTWLSSQGGDLRSQLEKALGISLEESLEPVE